jgi:MFS family permease
MSEEPKNENAPANDTPVENSGAANAIAPNAMRLLWAGFMAILAAGVGFAIRGGIFDNWGSEYGFTGAQLGAIGGAGFSGFCFGIILGGIVCDKWGYGKLVILAFACHVLSAFVTFAASGDGAYQALYWGMFIFAYANGTLEAVANPLVATLFPKQRTHYLNILHASWPAGLIIGGALGWVLDDKMALNWKLQLSLYLVPTVIYGLMFLGQKYPKSEASEKGLSLGEMLKDVGLIGSAVIGLMLWLFSRDALGPMLNGVTGAEFFVSPAWGYVSIAIGVGVWLAFSGLSGFSVGAPILFILFLTHALVGAVELGTDGWIQNITGNILTSEQGKFLFVWTSLVMFALRFCAHFIEKNLKLSPVGLLFVCSILAAIGLNMVSGVDAFMGAVIALTVYGIGKTFFWPTMLAVASDRFPRTGAVAISIMGGIGMMSAGLIGSPGLGYAKDRFASEELQRTSPEVYAQVKSETSSKFLFFNEITGIDGKKLGEAKEAESKTESQLAIVKADQQGDRDTLVADSFIPATMAVIFLLLMLYFKTLGGYKPVQIDTEKITGGTEGPAEF